MFSVVLYQLSYLGTAHTEEEQEPVFSSLALGLHSTLMNANDYVGPLFGGVACANLQRMRHSKRMATANRMATAAAIFTANSKYECSSSMVWRSCFSKLQ